MLSSDKEVRSMTEEPNRQPEQSGKITRNLILGCALAESTAIYGLLIAILLIFMN